MVVRDKFQELLQACEEMPAVGIIGLRQVGKTTLAKQILNELNDEYIYLDLERPSDLRKIEDAELYFTSRKNKRFILDEIQTKPELFPLLRSLIDEDRVPGKFIVLGSASPQLLRQSSESLAGRIRYIQLPPLQLLEVNEITTQQEHWLKGGFPNSILVDLAKSNRWREDYIKTITERDLPQLGFPGNSQFTFRFLTMIANLNGQLWNANNLAKSLELNNKTVNSYKDFLENAFILKSLQPWYINAKKRMIKSPKVYLSDTGILHSLLQITEMENLFSHPIIGFSWEGYVIEQVISNLPFGYEPYFANSSNNAEIDLLLVKANKPKISIEIKLTDAPKVPRGFTNLSEDFEVEKRYIVTTSSDRYWITKETEVINLQDFLVEAVNFK